MKKILILWLLVAAVAQALGAAYIDLSASWTMDGVPQTGVDSIVAVGKHWGATPLHWITAAPDSSIWDTTVVVDSIAEYKITYYWYLTNGNVMRDKDRAWSWSATAGVDIKAADTVTYVDAANMTKIDGLATATGAAGLKLKKLTIANDTGVAFAATGGSNYDAVRFTGGAGGNTHGLYTTGSQCGIFGDIYGAIYGHVEGKVFGCSSPNGLFTDAVWPLEVALVSTGTDADTGIVALKGTLAAVKTKTDKLTFNAQDSLIIDYSNIPVGTVTIPDSLLDTLTAIHADVNGISAGTGITEAEMWDMLDTLSSSVLDVNMYPLIAGQFTVDGAGTNARTQFVVDTASLGTFSSNWQAIRDRSYLLRSMSDNKVQIPLIIHSVAYTGANCTLTVADSVPIDFAAGDTIQMTGIYSPELASLSETADTVSDRTISTDTTGLRGDPTVGGMIMTGGSSSSDTTDIKTMLDNNLFTQAKDTFNLIATTTGNGRLPRYGELPAITQAGLDSLAATAKRLNDTLTSQEWAANAASCSGSGSRSVTMYARDTLNDARVSGATITMTSGATQYWGQTNTSGSVVFSLDDGIWRATGNDGLRSYVPHNILISGTTVDSVKGGGVIILHPTDTLMTRVYGFERVGPDTLKGATVELELINYDKDSLAYYGASRNVGIQSTRTNSVGYWQIDVIPSAHFGSNARYIYRVLHPRIKTVVPHEIIVPSGSPVDVTTLY